MINNESYLWSQYVTGFCNLRIKDFFSVVVIELRDLFQVNVKFIQLRYEFKCQIYFTILTPLDLKNYSQLSRLRIQPDVGYHQTVKIKKDILPGHSLT